MPAASLTMTTDPSKTSTGTIGQYHAGKIVELREVRRRHVFGILMLLHLFLFVATFYLTYHT